MRNERPCVCGEESKMAAKAAWLPEGNAAQVARESARRPGRAKKYAAPKQSTARGADSSLPYEQGKIRKKTFLKDKPPRGKYIQNGAPVRVELRRQNKCAF